MPRGRKTAVLDEALGFCKIATLYDVRQHNYALTLGRYVDAVDAEEDDEPFEEKLPRLTALLREQTRESARLDAAIEGVLKEVGNGG